MTVDSKVEWCLHSNKSIVKAIRRGCIQLSCYCIHTFTHRENAFYFWLGVWQHLRNAWLNIHRVYSSMITANTMITSTNAMIYYVQCSAHVLALFFVSSIIMMINVTFGWRWLFFFSSSSFSICFFCDHVCNASKYCSFIDITFTLMMHTHRWCEEMWTFSLSLLRENDETWKGILLVA